MKSPMEAPEREKFRPFEFKVLTKPAGLRYIERIHLQHLNPRNFPNPASKGNL
jgi:hypothetical protein